MSDISDAADRAAVAGAIRAIFEAFAAGRSDLIEEILSEDCTVWDVFTPELVSGRAERQRFHADDQAQRETRGPLGWTLHEPLVSLLGDVAIARYLLDFTYQPPNPASGRVRITDVLQRRGGTWRVVHHHEGLVPGGPP